MKISLDITTTWSVSSMNCKNLWISRRKNQSQKLLPRKNALEEWQQKKKALKIRAWAKLILTTHFLALKALQLLYMAAKIKIKANKTPPIYQKPQVVLIAVAKNRIQRVRMVILQILPASSFDQNGNFQMALYIVKQAATRKPKLLQNKT